MKKVIRRNSTSRILGIGLALMLSFTTTLFAQDQQGDPAAGKSLFNTYCAACHNLDRRMTGPALRGVGDKHDREWLHAWVKNSQALIKSGDEEANKLWDEYKPSVMTAFPQLSNQDIDNIIAYTMAPKEEKKPTDAGTGTGTAQNGGSGGVGNEIILGALVLVFGVLVVMLFLVNKTLRRIAAVNGVEFPEKEERMPLWRAFVKNQFLVLVSVVFLLLASAYFAFGYLMQVGVDQGYQPIQPIHFSHKIHAGDNKIDCKYCHSSARTSKTSGIPSLNVCMNCHKSIPEVAEETGGAEYSKEFYDGEIAKLYKAVGWDVQNQEYTGETEPVKWVRIHNLPDFAYFNHSQHVTVGRIACQECHGPVQEMEILHQEAPLTMGWCINCHRKTNVKMEGNEYYTKIHDELSKKYGVEELTAAQLGGIECAKCHY
ncbi:c-type cytochrome [Galbibacter pacificus]|uniref:C-type cytochrome n=1 Tax=Galbibacter pacificus TaxID=2996052 RepID=A0ABT6FTH5_9FLAO|nr:c-type cytochrome [Galbibacter pacificus]MDG3583075.1 c-type cytochrome [Galbibacter pacificus]MDG3586556.1 c-type cytochrome [Galbibacter pacificus]